MAENKHDCYVLELSSFQLDGIINYKPDIAVLLNISPDHLDRYNYDYNLYIDSKFRITMNQNEDDYLIYDEDDEAISNWLANHKIQANKLPFSLTKKNRRRRKYYRKQRNQYQPKRRKFYYANQQTCFRRKT